MPIKKIERDFVARGIPVKEPGFCDHEAFLAVEKTNPEYLNNYAKFVLRREYDEDYLARARAEIPVIVQSLHQELLADGRKGACVDASGVLSRILDRVGYWNFVVKGSLTIDYPKTSAVDRHYFWSFDEGNFEAGHAWVVAPPFSVIDFTIQQQEHTLAKESELLPAIVVAEKVARCEASIEDLAAPFVRAYLASSGVSSKGYFSALDPKLPLFLRTFQACRIDSSGTDLKYSPVGIGAPDCPLEELVGFSTHGKNGAALYAELVEPRLAAYRASSGIVR